MRALVVILAAAALCGSWNLIAAQSFLGSLANVGKGIINSASSALQRPEEFSCNRDVSDDFTKGMYDFAMRLYKRVAFYNKDHFAMSPLSIWMSIAAVAEGADGLLQRQLFAALNLPEERCLREKYYQIATSRERPGNDVRFLRKRVIVMDQALRVNSTWTNFIQSTGLINIAYAPIKSNPQAVSTQMQQFLNTRDVPTFSGNSVLLDSLDYQGLWTTAFPEASIERAPFFDDLGQKVGMVDYLKMKKRVKLAHIPGLNAKVLDLPVGNNGRYRMMFIINLSKNSIRSSFEMLVNSFITQILANLKESLIPLDIAIPRFAMNFEFEASKILDELGFGSIWKNPETTWLLSYPPAQPSGLFQRVSLKIDHPGLEALKQRNILNPLTGLTSIASSMSTGLAAAVGRDFIANRPFMYVLFDDETKTCLLSGAYSQPSVMQ